MRCSLSSSGGDITIANRSNGSWNLRVPFISVVESEIFACRDFVFDNIMEWYLSLRDEIYVTHIYRGAKFTQTHFNIFIFFLFSFLVPAWVYQVSPGRSKKPFAMGWDMTINTLESVSPKGEGPFLQQRTRWPPKQRVHFILSLRWREARVFLQTTSLIFHLYRHLYNKHINLFHQGEFVASQCH